MVRWVVLVVCVATVAFAQTPSPPRVYQPPPLFNWQQPPSYPADVQGAQQQLLQQQLEMQLLNRLFEQGDQPLLDGDRDD